MPPFSSSPEVSNRPVMRIDIGDVAVSGDDVVFRTTLGSCVSVVLYDVRKRIGGVNHFQAPGRPPDRDRLRRPGAYASNAVELLIKGMYEKGCRIEDLRAKVFGGGSMNLDIEQDAVGVGNSNILAAKHLLRLAGIPVVASSTGGSTGRTIYFVVREFKVLQRRFGVG